MKTIIIGYLQSNLIVLNDINYNTDSNSRVRCWMRFDSPFPLTTVFWPLSYKFFGSWDQTYVRLLSRDLQTSTHIIHLLESCM